MIFCFSEVAAELKDGTMALAKALPQVAELGPLARPSANGRMRDVRPGASTRLIFVGLLALRLVDGFLGIPLV